MWAPSIRPWHRAALPPSTTALENSPTNSRSRPPPYKCPSPPPLRTHMLNILLVPLVQNSNTPYSLFSTTRSIPWSHSAPMPFHRFHFFQGGSERGGFWHLQTVLADGETGLLANSNATSPPLYQAPPHPGSGDGSGEEGNVIIGSPMQLGRSPNTACLEPRLPNPNTPPSDPALSSQRPRTKQNTMASTSSDQPPSDSSRFVISFHLSPSFVRHPFPPRTHPSTFSPLTPILGGLATPVVSYAPRPRPTPPPTSPLRHHTPQPPTPAPERRQQHQINPRRRPTS